MKRDRPARHGSAVVSVAHRTTIANRIAAEEDKVSTVTETCYWPDNAPSEQSR
jgi:hypothetical protein